MAGRLYDTYGGRKTVTLGGAVITSSLALLSYSSNYPLILTSIATFSVGVSLVTASLPPLVSSVVKGEVRGAALGLMEAIKDVGQALGPIATGLILASAPYGTAFAVVAVATLAIIPGGAVLSYPRET